MNNPMSLADRLSALNFRFRFRYSTRPRRRPTARRWQVANELSSLEEHAC